MVLIPGNHWVKLSALAIIAVLLFFYLIGSMRDLQYKLLYYPSSSPPAEKSLQLHNMAMWHKSGTYYRGIVATGELMETRGTVIVFHGNGGTAADRKFYLDSLGAMGYRVILAEYPMYGGRKGELGERSFVSDARESIRLAHEEYGAPLFVLGESLGCGIASAALKEMPVHIDGLILITPWDTLESVARDKFPGILVRFLLKDEYDNIDNLSSFRGRIAVIGAERDEVIPYQHAAKLYNSLPGESKRMWMFKEAGHNDWYMYADEAWWKEIMYFISAKN